MSAFPRQLELCPGVPRRLRVEGRKLCLCGPGGGGPTCGICYGRALTGDPYDQCGGLFAPHHSIGARFRVARTGIGGGFYISSDPVTGQNVNYSFNAVYQDVFVVASREFPPGSGPCLPSIESWDGGGSAGRTLTVTGPDAYSGTGTFTGQEWEFWEYAAPPVFPIQGVGPGSLPFYLPPGEYSPVSCPTVDQASYCGYAYPRPHTAATYGIKVPNSEAEQRIVLPGNPPLYVLGQFSGSTYGATGGPSDSGWPGEQCAGFYTVNGGGWDVQTETWQNEQRTDGAVARWIVNKSGTLAGSGGPRSMRAEWNGAIEVTRLDPCPGDSPPNPLNAALIERHNGRGIQGVQGCCG